MMDFATGYTTAFMAAFGGYSLQMLLTPGKMVTDHFDTPATPMLKFWIRGTSVPMFGLIAAMQSLPQETNLMIATAVSAGIGLVYPWNAKFGYLTDGKLPTKYPMHYVPEVLMTVLTGAGLYCLFTSKK